jgi:predicted AAA+ superfamily ATPase
MYTRSIKNNIVTQLSNQKIIILYGARQVGKTTLVKEIAQESGLVYRYLNADEYEIRQWLESESADWLRNFIGSYPLVIIDEAQRIPNIWIKLKLLHDTFPDQKIIATGSSSFELANKINEPLTWRMISFMLYPLSVYEIKSQYDYILPTETLHRILRTGSYPNVFTQDDNQAKLYLKELANNYLYKDILSIESIQKSSHIQKLLQLLAYQLGQEVSLNELSNKLNLHVTTVDRYIGILEQMFIVMRVPAWSTNQRNEIGKKEKIYFWDCGIRNAIIDGFDHIDTRSDIWALWENFCITEKIKYNHYNNISTQTYFRRNYQQQEIDNINIQWSQMDAYEYKRNSKKTASLPKQFKESYPQSSFQVINPKNYHLLFVS